MGVSRCLVLAALAAVSAAPSIALGQTQTWANGARTPVIEQLVAVDATGEPDWPYGSEDIAGDGTTFQQQEASADLRTVYAATDQNQFWVRAYVSDVAAPGGNIKAYVFIDADDNPASGGDAVATDIDPALTAGASTDGGYEYLLGIEGNGSTLGLWHWDGAAYASVTTAANDILAQVGTDIDPILVNEPTHGYLQGMVALAVVELTAACNANLFVRSVNVLGASDLDVGSQGSCNPVDSDTDNVPDLVDPTGTCQTDADCPAGGTCIDQACVYTRQCNQAGDCATGETCTANHLCVVMTGGNCSTDADCGDRLCLDGQCGPCTDDEQCGPGRACRADGRCVTGTGDVGTGTGGSAGATGGATGTGGGPAGTGGGSAGTGGVIGADEEVRGGAFTCALSAPSSKAIRLSVLLGIGVAAGLVRRRRRPKNSTR